MDAPQYPLHIATTATTTTTTTATTTVLFLLITVSQWSPSRSALVQQEDEFHGCMYEGHVIRPGARFKPDRCTRCFCPFRGGPPRCRVQDCAKETHCIRYINDTNVDDCCPKCVEYGCRHSNDCCPKRTDYGYRHPSGEIFQPGEVIREEPCVRCYCPVGGGNPVCDVTSCPLSQCVDPVKIEGVCCPVCPRGPNCQIGLLTLPVNQSVTVEGAVCRCETFINLEGQKQTMARCNKN